MFCVGSKIIFADGRVAIARNGAEIEKILAMDVKFAEIACKADSLALSVKFADGVPAEIEWENADKGEKFAVKSDKIALDDVKKITAHFMDTGEMQPEYNWEKA